MESWQWARALKWEVRRARLEEAVREVRVTESEIVVGNKSRSALQATFQLTSGATWTSTIDLKMFDKYHQESLAIETVLALRESLARAEKTANG